MADEVTPSVFAAAATLPPKSLMAVSLSMAHCKEAYGLDASTLTARRVLIHAMTLKDRIEEVMHAKNWQVHHVATVAGVSSAAVSQWIGHGGKKQTKSIGDFEAALKLEKATGYSARWLAKGIGPKLAVGQMAGEGKRAVDASVTNTNTDDRQIIPTSAMFTPLNLSATILLLGSMLARMDPLSRQMMGLLLAKLASEPDEAQDVAEKASGIVSKQKAVTSSKSLDAAIQGKDGAFVETAPSRLE